MADEFESLSEANLPRAAAPLHLIFDGRYAYIGLRRFPAHCWLRVYVTDDTAGDLPVVVMSELPDNEGTSVTNFAEKLAWQILHDQAVWVQAPGAAREGALWIEHYVDDGSAFGETFSIVTFAHSPAAEAEADTLGTLHVVQTDPDTGDVDNIRAFSIKPADNARHGSLGEPEWARVTRAQVEQLIGQPFPAVGGTGTDGR
jgi:hypothetical protein